jgi:hypothetical protein
MERQREEVRQNIREKVNETIDCFLTESFTCVLIRKNLRRYLSEKDKREENLRWL